MEPALANLKLVTALRGVGPGRGMAVCVPLRRLVTSNDHNLTLTLFTIRPDGTFALQCTIGGKGRGPLQFATDQYMSGWMCFTVGSDVPTLLVTDAGNDRVHELDVSDARAPAHVGFPIRVLGPRGVAASASLLAVTAWKHISRGEHVVHAFDAVTRAPLFTAGCGLGSGDGQLSEPYSLRVSNQHIVVAARGNNRVSAFRTSDGAFAGHLALAVIGAAEVEEWDGGWLVACFDMCTVNFVGSGTRIAAARIGGWGWDSGKFQYVSALATVPGVGLLVRDESRVQVFSRPEDRRMAGMSRARAAWLGCAVRASCLSA